MYSHSDYALAWHLATWLYVVSDGKKSLFENKVIFGCGGGDDNDSKM